MLREFQNMSLQELMDALAQKTQVLTQFLAEKNFGPEYEECKQTIKEMQSEIDMRKETKTDRSSAHVDHQNPA